MCESIIDYYNRLPQAMNFIHLQDNLSTNQELFRMDPQMGTGTARLVRFRKPGIILGSIDYVPKESFEKVVRVKDEYLEITCLESSAYGMKVGTRKTEIGDRDIYFMVGDKRPVYTYAEKGKRIAFTKIILTREYLDQEGYRKAGITFEKLKGNIDLLNKSAKHNALNFILHQIINCQADGDVLELFIEGKVTELLISAMSFVQEEQTGLSVKLDRTDIRGLKKSATYMRNHLKEYPSNKDLAQLANMSPSRYLLAFRKYYGTTPYAYMKEHRMNEALILLKDSTLSIRTVAEKVGYTKQGHFAKLFREAYGVSPKKYRDMNSIK